MALIELVGIERVFQLAPLAHGLVFDFFNTGLGRVNGVLDHADLLVHFSLGLLLGFFAVLDQTIKQLLAVLADLGVCAQTGQPDLPRVLLYFADPGAGFFFDFFLACHDLFSLLSFGCAFKHCIEHIELSRECINVLLGRNAQAIETAGNATIKGFFDFFELAFNLAFHFGNAIFHVVFNAVDLAVGSFNLLINQLLALLLDALASLDQVLQVTRAFLASFGVSAQASQVDLARIALNIGQYGSFAFAYGFLDCDFSHDTPHTE